MMIAPVFNFFPSIRHGTAAKQPEHASRTESDWFAAANASARCSIATTPAAKSNDEPAAAAESAAEF